MILLSKVLMKILGWKTNGALPEDKKCVIVAAPHTSNWDFIIGRLSYYASGKKIIFLIKKEFFFFPFGGILKKLGGVPVDRSRNNNTVEQVAKIFRENDQVFLTIAPEGTRKKVKKWKRGFYLIAKRSKVPIYLGMINYKDKEIGYFKKFEMTDDINADMIKIKNHYKNAFPKFPENFSTGLD